MIEKYGVDRWRGFGMHVCAICGNFVTPDADLKWNRIIRNDTEKTFTHIKCIKNET